jgi:hypothetical protein
MRACAVAEGAQLLFTDFDASSDRAPVVGDESLAALVAAFRAWLVRHYEAAEKAVSDLRIALKRELGCDADPFEVLDDGHGWRPRFTAKREPPKDKMPTRR